MISLNSISERLKKINFLCQINVGQEKDMKRKKIITEFGTKSKSIIRPQNLQRKEYI